MTEYACRENCVLLDISKPPIYMDSQSKFESQPGPSNSMNGVNSCSEESDQTITNQTSMEENLVNQNNRNDHEKPNVKFYESLEQTTKFLHEPSPMKLKPVRSCLKFEKRGNLEAFPKLNFDDEMGDEMEEDCSSQFQGGESFEDLWAKRFLRIDKLSDSFKCNRITSEVDQSKNNSSSYQNQQNDSDVKGQEFNAGGKQFQQVGQQKISRKRSRMSMILE